MKLVADSETTLLQFVRENFPDISLTKAKKMIFYGCFSYKDAVAKSPEMVLPAKAVVVYTKYIGGKKNIKERTPLPVLFEDEYLLVALKPAGMQLDASSNEKQKSFFATMKSYVRKNTHAKQNVFLVHSMATEDTGLCLMAKTKMGQIKLKERWGDDCQLHYKALIHGTLSKKSDKLTFWLKPLTDRKPVQVPANSPQSTRTQTEYRVVQLFNGYSTIELIPISDFPSQLHFCMERMNTPILGDYTYGDKQNPRHLIKLIGYKMAFKHPFTAKRIVVETAIPESFHDVSQYRIAIKQEKEESSPLP